MWTSWRFDEASIRVKGEWKYLYRAVNKHGKTIDLLLTAKRDHKAAKRFVTKAISRNGIPEKSNSDTSGASAAAIVSSNAEHGTQMHIRTSKYLQKRMIKKKQMALGEGKEALSAAEQFYALASSCIMHQ